MNNHNDPILEHKKLYKTLSSLREGLEDNFRLLEVNKQYRAVGTFVVRCKIEGNEKLLKDYLNPNIKWSKEVAEITGWLEKLNIHTRITDYIRFNHLRAMGSAIKSLRENGNDIRQLQYQYEEYMGRRYVIDLIENVENELKVMGEK